MAEINQTLTQLKLEPANNKNLRSFVGELNGNLKILEKGFGVKIFKMGTRLVSLAMKKILRKPLMQFNIYMQQQPKELSYLRKKFTWQ